MVSDGQILLLIGRNESFQIYKAPHSENVVFTWPDKSINGNTMELIESEGKLSEPLSVTVGRLQCTVLGLSIGTLFTEMETSSPAHECPSVSNWKIYFPVALTVILSLILAGGGYKTLEPKILRRRMEQLSEVATMYTENGRTTAL